MEAPRGGTQVQLRGVLRAVHLDDDWLEVLVDGKAVHVAGLRETVDDTIGPMINRSVVVLATRNARGRYLFADIETED